ncbi:MAG: hypothetical protein PVF68_15140, partial [Acidobacteriota bacterium]
MADSSGSGSNLPVVALVALAALTGGFFYYRGALTPTRPGDTPLRAPEDFQQVHARLWEDPLVVMRQHREWERALRGGKEAPEFHGIDELWDAVDPHQRSSLLVLPVVIAGGPYAEDHESRLRTRYAVLSALGAARFIPRNAAELAYFLWDGTGNCPPGGQSCRGVPYEWWTLAAEGPSRSVLVLWLPDDRFDGEPFGNLRKLEDHLLRNEWIDAETLARFTDIHIRLIGPRTSDGLFAMLRETNCAERWLPEVLPVSPWATYPLASMRDELALLDCPGLQGGEAREPVERTILDDGVVLESMLTELRRRRAPRSADPAGALVIIVSEWDTLYGRRMVRTLEKARDAMKEDPGCVDPALASGDDRPCDPWEQIVHITYQRGLDGRLPGDAAPAVPSGDDAGGAGEFAQPIGRSRLDYALRLARAIETRYRDQEVAAIGVLGSDFYDKILILQALRPRFSRSLFFTTDLDARYLQSIHLPWSRNLLVASSFGLALRADEPSPPSRDEDGPPGEEGAARPPGEGLDEADRRDETHPPAQDGLPTSVGREAVRAPAAEFDGPDRHGEETHPPFRDAQTSVEPETVRSPEGELDDTERQEETHPPFRDGYQTSMYLATLRALGEEPAGLDLRSRVYEIGRTRPVLVARGVNDVVSHPTFRHPVGVGLLGLFGIAVVLWVVHLTAGLHAVRWKALLLTVVLPAGLYGLLFLVLNGSLGFLEPFLLVEGVSLWPTELMRVLAFCLSLCLLAVSVRYLAERNRETARMFEFGTSERKGWMARELLELMSRVSTRSADRLWHEYADRTGGRYCAAHVLVMCLLYFGVGFSLMQLGPAPMVPFRGAAAFWFDQAALIPGILAMILLIMYVLYQTLLCRSWVHALVNVEEWPPSRIGTQGPFDSTGYRAIRLVARQTRVIGRVTYYPFVILFLMILSRSTYFDRWDWPIPLIILIGLNSAYLLGCALVLRLEAEKLRRRAVRNLQAKRIAATGRDEETVKRT